MLLLQALATFRTTRLECFEHLRTLCGQEKIHADKKFPTIVTSRWSLDVDTIGFKYIQVDEQSLSLFAKPGVVHTIKTIPIILHPRKGVQHLGESESRWIQGVPMVFFHAMDID